MTPRAGPAGPQSRGWDPEVNSPDLRLAALGAAAWAGALTGHVAARGWSGAATLTALAVAVVVASVPTWRRGRPWVLAGLVLGVISLVRVEVTSDNVLAELAQRRALATVTATVVSDPVVRPGRFADVVVYRARVTGVSAPVAARTRAPAVVLAPAGSDRPPYGSSVRLQARLAPADGPDTSALLSVRGPPVVLSAPSALHRGAERVRGSIRAAAGGPTPGDHLVPALVDGDDAALPSAVVDDFRTAGLTHLTAVSGANLTILLAFLLPFARWSGVRAHGLLVVGALGIVGFVLVARPEPSVLRAAAMGTAALVGLGWGGRVAGARALGGAVLGLLLLDPGLAVTWGFALSVVATAGILVLAPGLRDSMSGYLPRWLAEAVAVPVAAQLACTPLVAVLSAEVSMVAVLANLAAAPLVGPTTILGLAGGLLGLVSAPVGALPGWLAGTCAHGIVLVARVSADAPGAAVPWSPSGAALVGLVALCLLLAGLVPRLLRQRRAALLLTGALVVVLARPPLPAWVGDVVPGRGWPPPGWALVMCDVGQGDAVVLSAGRGRAVVVDAGPDPRAVDRCLGRLGVRDVPVVVLTHFHDDHVAGLPGVLGGREVGEVLVSPLREPAHGVTQVEQAVGEAGVPLRVPAAGETVTVGPLRWQLLGPARAVPDDPNDSSLVLLAETHGTSILLAGDAEPGAQAALRHTWGLGQVDVLKVAHHGSRHQDDALARSLQPRAALISAGQDNDYGHPSPRTIDVLRATGAAVWRTDVSGDLAVVPLDDGGVGVVPRG